MLLFLGNWEARVLNVGFDFRRIKMNKSFAETFAYKQL